MAGVRIFISYARNDDRIPPDVPDAKGFVTFLHNQLLFALDNTGPDRPDIWRDIEEIDPADQFRTKIQAGIQASSIMIVILSRHWMESKYCREELDAFVKRWSSEGLNARERIVVVSKHHVERAARPEWLQGQVGHKFYTHDEGEELEDEFFRLGRPKDDRYWETFYALLKTLLLRTRVRQRDFPPSAPPAAKAGRTIYVARPAGDMRAAYERVVKEMQGRGYLVVPDAKQDIPSDSSATAFIDEHMGKAEVSVHLLGEKSGAAPEDQEPIVKLQLARAALRLDGGNAGGASRFRRLIWAPKVMEETAGSLPEGGGRDPAMVVEKFDRQRSGDKVFGDNLSAFVIFLEQNLDKSPALIEPAESIDANAQIYVIHRDEDRRYAIDIAKTLRDKVQRDEGVEPILSGLKGNAGERARLHRRNLIDCDTVVLCWAKAGETWAKTASRELKNWRALGRPKEFARRGLVLGPPPDSPKSDFVEVPPKSEIDLVLDLTNYDSPPPERLAELVPGAHAPGQ